MTFRNPYARSKMAATPANAHLSQSATAYQCNAQGVFVGGVSCQRSPLDGKGWFLVPGGATTVAPPTFDPATQIATFNFSAKTWVISLVAPVVEYPSMFTFQVGTPVNVVPTISKGVVGNFSISPDLPPGLAINAKTGVISGTPTEASPAKPYLITAYNADTSAMIDTFIRVSDSSSN